MEIDLPREDLTKLQMGLERLPSGLYMPRWLVCDADGAAHVAAPHRRTETYTDGTYNFYCDAPHGALLTDPVWHIERFTIATKSSVHAYGQVATDSATVAALAATIYNGGSLL